MSPTRYHYATLLGLQPLTPASTSIQQYLLFYSMNFQASSNPEPAVPTPHRKIGVILLTDNRQANTGERSFPDYRCSAFKQTQVDPFEERHKDYLSFGAQNIDDLIKRITKLENKVDELYILEEGLTNRPQNKGKKIRRRFSEMDRNFQCSLCRKQYGSETALKCHQKLKHSSRPNEQEE